jgi:hypothetical protein
MLALYCLSAGGSIAGKYLFKRGKGNVTEAIAKLQTSKADSAFIASNDVPFAAGK